MVSEKRVRYIYCITNVINGKNYFGKRTVSTKCKNLASDLYWGSGTLLKKAQKKYGLDNFKKEIILSGEFSKEQINRFEKCIIATQRLIGKAEYNLADGGDGGDNSRFIDYDFAKKRQKETYEKLREKDPDIFKKRSLKTAKTCKEKGISFSHPCSWKGKSNPYLSEEGRKAMSENAKRHNANRSEKTRAKVKASLKALYANDLKNRISKVQSKILEGLQTNMKIEELSKHAGFGSPAQLRMWLVRHNLKTLPILREQFKETGTIIL